MEHRERSFDANFLYFDRHLVKNTESNCKFFADGSDSSRRFRSALEYVPNFYQVTVTRITFLVPKIHRI